MYSVLLWIVYLVMMKICWQWKGSQQISNGKMMKNEFNELTMKITGAVWWKIYRTSKFDDDLGFVPCCLSGWFKCVVYRCFEIFLWCLDLIHRDSPLEKWGAVSAVLDKDWSGGLEHDFCFPFHIWDVILPIDFHSFQDGRYTTNQWCLVMKICEYSWPKGYQEMREHLESGEHKQQIRIGGRCPNGFRGLARTEMVCGLLSASRNLTSNHIETIHASQFCWLLRPTFSHKMFHETNKPRLSLKFTDYCPYFAHKSSNCTVWVWIKTHLYWRHICGGWTSIAANYFNGYKFLNPNIHTSWIYAYNCNQLYTIPIYKRKYAIYIAGL